MALFLLVVVSIVFSIQAIRARLLITSALWLAGTSALLSVVFYLFGAHLVAVIELSVGAGLVTVLLAFAISVAGDEMRDNQPVIPKPVSFGLILLFVILIGFYASRLVQNPVLPPATESSLVDVLWQERGLDMLVQVVLIFSSVLGLLGLLAEAKGPLDGSVAEEVAARRERDLSVMESQLQEQGERVK